MRKLIDGLTINIPEDVYDPAEDSFLLAENVKLINHEKVLEVGSGSGYVSIFLARNHPEADFIGLDLNFSAAKVSKENSKENNLDLEFLNCDLMNALIGKDVTEPFFDVIIFNTPYLPITENGDIELAWAGGKDGLEVISKFIIQFPRILKKTGRCYIVISSKTNLNKLKKQIKKTDYKMTLVDEIKEGRETIKLYLLKTNKF